MTTTRDHRWYAVAAAFALAVISIWQLVGGPGALRADEIASSQAGPYFNPQTEIYDADVSDLRVSPSTVYPGDSATIRATFTNEVRTSSGEGTFDIVFVIVKPDGGTEDIVLADPMMLRAPSGRPEMP